MGSVNCKWKLFKRSGCELKRRESSVANRKAVCVCVCVLVCFERENLNMFGDN